jgi:lysophospholipase L1-like esterase
VAQGQMPLRNPYDVLPALAKTLYPDSNYLSDFQKGATSVLDFYLPNDTHLSLNGYRFFAKAVEKRIRAHAHIPLLDAPQIAPNVDQ